MKTAIPVIVWVLVLAAITAGAGQASDPNAVPSAYRLVENWPQLPPGRTLGSTIGVAVDRAGNVWVADFCGADSCIASSDAPIHKFDPSGKLLRSFGGGMFVNPHDVYVDGEGNIWVSDSGNRKIADKGYQVVKFSPEGKVLMTLGKAGVSAAGPDTFLGPSRVYVAPNGDIFVTDSVSGIGCPYGAAPCGGTEAVHERVAKFSKDGTFLASYSKHGTGPGQFNYPHGIAQDSRGWFFIADLANNRVQIYDKEFKFLEEWRQFGRPHHLIVQNDILYVADALSGPAYNPGYPRGIKIGSVKDGKVTAFIPDRAAGKVTGMQAVAVDAQGNVYVAETGRRTVGKYEPINPLSHSVR